jgi:hypothetical protein
MERRMNIYAATMSVGESDYRGFAFLAPDLPTGVTITSATVSVFPTTGLAIDSPNADISTDGTGVYAWLTASAPGVYDVKFIINFSDTKTLVRIRRVTVN